MEELNRIIDEMIEVKDTIARINLDKKQWEQKEELLNIKLLAILNEKGINEMILPNCYFGIVKKSRTAFDQKLFSTAYPDLYDEFKTTSETEKFEFKIGAKK